MNAPAPGARGPVAPTPELPPAVGGEGIDLDTPVGRVHIYRAGPAPGADSGLPPLVLLHSINASGSAAEVAPLFEHYRQHRTVVAIDLPGFGLSDRADIPYTPRTMTDALLAVVDHVRAGQGGGVVDVLGVSLSVEYVARAQMEAADVIRRIALVSPTGFSRRKRRYGPPGSNLGVPWLYRLLRWPRWTEGVYNNLTRPGVIRYFLERTWGSKAIDEALWRYDLLTTRQPGARHAPLRFVSAYLFSGDINAVYDVLTCPVWMSMATRGDFTDYQGAWRHLDNPRWKIQPVEGGALPYFEDLPAFTAALDPFWAAPDENFNEIGTKST